MSSPVQRNGRSPKQQVGQSRRGPTWLSVAAQLQPVSNPRDLLARAISLDYPILGTHIGTIAEPSSAAALPPARPRPTSARHQ